MTEKQTTTELSRIRKLRMSGREALTTSDRRTQEAATRPGRATGRRALRMQPADTVRPDRAF